MALGRTVTGGRSAQCHFPAIFNFGDSNSDTGGLSSAFGQAGPPHGSSFFGSPAGRYCDGRLVIDFIAESLGLPYLSAFLDSVGSNFSHGANFATAGSPIIALNSTLRQSGGVYTTMLPEADSFSQALYTFDIGQNDLTAAYFANKTVEQIGTTDVPEIISQFKNAVTFNDALKQAVIEVRASLSEAGITYVDVYSAKHELFVHAQGHGFKRSLVACCGHGGKYNYNKNIGCGKKVTVKGKEIYIGKPCDEPDKAVIWDGVHFTQAANKFIFDKIAAGLSMACHRQ
ncbi:hypothetical protein Bca101_099603 [Brassica carinata]